MNFTDAQTYCANRNIGGLNQWRVPNIVELGTLIDYTLPAPFINPIAFPAIPSANFWSSTPDLGNVGSSWETLSSHYSYSAPIDFTTLNQVRCARSCYKAPTLARYTNASGVVTDITTGLIWQQVSTRNTMNWTNAITHCIGLNLNSHMWRLPTARELSTLIDYSVNDGSLMMNSSVFEGEPADNFWSFTEVVNLLGEAWGLNFRIGYIEIDLAENLHYVRCILNT